MNEKQPLHLVPGGDPSRGDELARLRFEIEGRDRQQTSIAELGQAALTGVDPYILLGQACALVELTLKIEHCRAIEITPGGRVVVRASMGSNETFLHCTRDDEENESLSTYVTVAGAPVTFSTAGSETRFKCTHLRDHHGVRSGVGIAIPRPAGVFGAILVFSSEERAFEDHEISFLRATASLLGEALQRSRTEDALRRSESRLKQLIASALDAVVTIDRDGSVIEWNPQAEATFGLRAREVVGRPLPGSVIPPPLHEIFDAVLRRNTTVLRRRMEAVARRAGGEEFPIEITIDPVGSGDEQTFTAFIRDISERQRSQRELEQREQRFRALVEKSWSGVALLDASLLFVYAGASTSRLLGYREDELVGRSFLDFIHPREHSDNEVLFTSLAATPGHEVQGEMRFLHKSGMWVWLEGFAQNLLHDESVGAIVVNYRDVTQRKATERQLEYQAYYDALTGLPNRLLFLDRVVTAIAQARRNRRGMAVMYLDLDHFKNVNDGLGHSTGDALLSEVAMRLATCVRASDTISRLGGDEFTILLNDTGNSDDVAGIARKILQSLAQPFSVDGHELFVTASIGISLYPSDGTDVETLLKCADSAMYRAKELGRNQSQLFTASMNERYVRRLEVEQRLHHALERGELEVYYQPIYDRPRRCVHSVEALVRWNHPERGLVGPAEFIPLAEETGLVVPIGEWVLDQTCGQLRKWHDRGLAGLRAAVNISAPQLQQPRFVDMVVDTIMRHDIDPKMIQLEITETVAVQNIERTMEVLRELRRIGVSVAIDDFGTGHSSLIYLKRFPIDTIKIDQAFVRDVTSDESAAAIVSYVINLAHSMRLNVVAEGVETDEQYSFLRLYACDLLQGFLFSQPLPAGAAYEFLRRDVRPPKTVEIRNPLV
jgi:diguanylate cyclase (GGDEF)-like protein/PAS domain S-box-containing protein